MHTTLTLWHLLLFQSVPKCSLKSLSANLQDLIFSSNLTVNQTNSKSSMNQSESSARLTEKSHAVASLHLNLLVMFKVDKARHRLIKRTRFTHTEREKEKRQGCMHVDQDKVKGQETGNRENKALEQRNQLKYVSKR